METPFKILNIKEFDENYYILDTIGEGCNGRIYSIIKNGKKYALKVSLCSTLEEETKRVIYFQNKFKSTVFEFYFQTFLECFFVDDIAFMSAFERKFDELVFLKVSEVEVCDLDHFIDHKESSDKKFTIRKKKTNILDRLSITQFYKELFVTHYILSYLLKIDFVDLHNGNILVKKIPFIRIYKFVLNNRRRYFMFNNECCPHLIDFDLEDLDNSPDPNEKFYETFDKNEFIDTKIYKIYKPYKNNKIFYSLFFTKFCKNYEIFEFPKKEYKIFDLDKIIPE